MAETDFKRAQRVGQQIQRELGDLLVNHLKDPRVGFVTVTEVRATDDLRTARVFVSIYGDTAARQGTLKGLEQAGGFLKRELAHRLNLRHTPNLSFVLDTTLDEAERLDQLISAATEGGAVLEAPAVGPAADIVPVQTTRSDLAERAETLKALPPPAKPPGRPRTNPTRRRRLGRRAKKRL